MREAHNSSAQEQESEREERENELQVLVPETGDPYRIAEGIREIATSETADNARQAEEEWDRAVPAQARQAFSAAPSISVRPGVGGVNVLVRYLTRARDRQQVRVHLYQRVVELLRGKNLPESVTMKAAHPSQLRAAESA